MSYISLVTLLKMASIIDMHAPVVNVRRRLNGQFGLTDDNISTFEKQTIKLVFHLSRGQVLRSDLFKDKIVNCIL